MSAARLKAIALGLWVAMALFTFGHSASQPKVCPNYGNTVWRECESAQIAFEAFPAAAFWPLYWSWELQQ